MMRSAILISLVVLVSMLGAEEYVLPDSIQKKIDEHQKDVAEIIQTAKQDVQDSQEKLIKVLEKELKSETRKGNFNNAMAITELIDAMKKKDEDSVGLFGKNPHIDIKPSRIKILKVALADGNTEKQGQVPFDFMKHVQMKVGRGEYVINFKEEFSAYFPKDFTFTKAWVDYTLDDGPKVYIEATGENFVVKIPEPLPKE